MLNLRCLAVLAIATWLMPTAVTAQSDAPKPHLLRWSAGGEGQPARCEMALDATLIDGRFGYVTADPAFGRIVLATTAERRRGDTTTRRVSRVWLFAPASPDAGLVPLGFGSQPRWSPDGSRLLVRKPLPQRPHERGKQTDPAHPQTLYEDADSLGPDRTLTDLESREIAMPQHPEVIWLGSDALLMPVRSGELLRVDANTDARHTIAVPQDLNLYQMASLGPDRFAVERMPKQPWPPQPNAESIAPDLVEVTLPANLPDDESPVEATVSDRLLGTDLNRLLPTGHRAKSFVTVRSAGESDDVFLTCIEEAADGRTVSRTFDYGLDPQQVPEPLDESVWRIGPDGTATCLMRAPRGHYLRLTAASVDGRELLLTAYLRRLGSEERKTAEMPVEPQSFVVGE